MTLEHVIVQRFKKEEMDEKIRRKTYKCYKAGKFLEKNDLAKSLFDMKQTLRGFPSKV